MNPYQGIVKCGFMIAVLVAGSVEATYSRQNADQTDDVIERLVEGDAEAVITDEIDDIRRHPIDLNTADSDMLEHVPGIDHTLAAGILSTRSGRLFANVGELTRVEGVTKAAVEALRPFVMVRVAPSGVMDTQIRIRAHRVLNRSIGFSRGVYPGNDLDHSFRTVLRWENNDGPGYVRSLQAAVVTTKDAGETGLASFASGYIAASFPFLLSEIVAGDYRIEYGQGLAISRGRSFGKGSNVLAPAQKGQGGIRPVASSMENGTLRGVAATWDFTLVRIAAAWSKRFLHGTVDSNGRITSIDAGGLFRTTNERERLRAATHTVRMARAELRMPGLFRFGVTNVQSGIDKPLALVPMGGRSSSALSVVSGDVEVIGNSFTAFIESAADDAGGRASIAGLRVRLMKTAGLAIVGRDYSEKFYSFFGSGFGERRTPPQNERGWYVGAQWEPAAQTTIRAYYDQFMFPGSCGTQLAPERGSDFFVELATRISGMTQVHTQYRWKDMPDETVAFDAAGRTTAKTTRSHRHSLRIEMPVRADRRLALRTRIEWVLAEGDATDRGIVLSQEANLSIRETWKIRGRLAYFGTDSYDARIVAVESEPWGAVMGPPLYGRGIRWYVTASWAAMSGLEFSAKYSHTFKEFVQSLGSGNDEIPGDQLSALSIQCDLSF